MLSIRIWFVYPVNFWPCINKWNARQYHILTSIISDMLKESIALSLWDLYLTLLSLISAYARKFSVCNGLFCQGERGMHWRKSSFVRYYLPMVIGKIKGFYILFDFVFTYSHCDGHNLFNFWSLLLHIYFF